MQSAILRYSRGCFPAFDFYLKLNCSLVDLSAAVPIVAFLLTNRLCFLLMSVDMRVWHRSTGYSTVVKKRLDAKELRRLCYS